MNILRFFKKKPPVSRKLTAETSKEDGEKLNKVKVYIPALSALLTRAEELKGTKLTRTEVERIANDASRLELPLDVALATQGYEPVTPETAWDYWTERSKEVSSDQKPSPRHVICALGNWNDFEVIQTVLNEKFRNFTLDTEYSILSPNPRMMDSFTVNQDKLPRSLTDKDWAAVEQHSAVVYVLSPPIEATNAEKISGEALQLVEQLFKHGATAIQSESAGLAHGKSEWLKLAIKYKNAVQNQDIFNAGIILFQAWVQRGIVEENTLSHTLGMHLLGHRDIEYLQTGETPENEIEWIDLLGYYIMGDKPDRPILNGEGFRLTENSGRRLISIEECNRYSWDDFHFNPYGYYRLNPEE